MKRTLSFTCKTCGQLHEGSPSISYVAPFHWKEPNRDDPSGASRLNDDFCMIERRDFFIRCILEVPIHDVEDPFLWGIWVSQSEKNFRHYAETFPNSPEQQTFGYFSNRLPSYPETLSLKTQAHWRSGKHRPWVELEPSDHPLYRDWSEGISWQRAVELAGPALHPGDR